MSRVISTEIIDDSHSFSAECDFLTFYKNHNKFKSDPSVIIQGNKRCGIGIIMDVPVYTSDWMCLSKNDG